MGKRGPAKKPTEVAIVDGTFRADRHGKAPLIVSDRANLEPPRGWPPAKKKAWRDLTRSLTDGLVQDVDLPALEMAAAQLATFRDAQECLERDGLMLKIVVGQDILDQDIIRLEVNPLIRVRDKAAQEFRAWCVRFGFDPSSRVSLGLGAVKTRSMAADLESKLKAPGGP